MTNARTAPTARQDRAGVQLHDDEGGARPSKHQTRPVERQGAQTQERQHQAERADDRRRH